MSWNRIINKCTRVVIHNLLGYEVPLTIFNCLQKLAGNFIFLGNCFKPNKYINKVFQSFIVVTFVNNMKFSCMPISQSCLARLWMPGLMFIDIGDGKIYIYDRNAQRSQPCQTLRLKGPLLNRNLTLTIFQKY